MHLTFTKIFGSITTLVGGVVLLGWALHWPFVLKLNPDFVAMQVNTAFCFFTIGLAILLHRSKYVMYHILSLPSCLLGFSTLIAYLTGNNAFFIDDQFHYHPLNGEQDHMAANTAICFAMAGAAIAGVDRPIIRKGIGFLIFCLALVAVFGYALVQPDFYKWGDATGMALHTAIGFVFVGLSLVTMNGYRRNKDIFQKRREQLDVERNNEIIW